jgi:hypothetical protein
LKGNGNSLPLDVADDVIDAISAVANGLANKENIDVYKTLTRFADITSADGKFEMGNEADGGFIVGISYHADGTTIASQGGICLNDQYPQLYYKTFDESGAVTSRILFELHDGGLYESKVLTGYDWKLVGGGGLTDIEVAGPITSLAAWCQSIAPNAAGRYYMQYATWSAATDKPTSLTGAITNGIMWIDLVRDSSAVSGNLTVSCRGRMWQGRLHEGSTSGVSVIDWTQITKSVIIPDSDTNGTWLALANAYADITYFYIGHDHEAEIMATNDGGERGDISRHRPFSDQGTVLVTFTYTNSDSFDSVNLLEIRVRSLGSQEEYTAILNNDGSIEHWNTVLTSANASPVLNTIHPASVEDFTTYLISAEFPFNYIVQTSGCNPAGEGSNIEGTLQVIGKQSFFWVQTANNSNAAESQVWVASYRILNGVWDTWRRIDGVGGVSNYPKQQAAMAGLWLTDVLAQSSSLQTAQYYAASKDTVWQFNDPTAVFDIHSLDRASRFIGDGTSVKVYYLEQEFANITAVGQTYTFAGPCLFRGLDGFSGDISSIQVSQPVQPTGLEDLGATIANAATYTSIPTFLGKVDYSYQNLAWEPHSAEDGATSVTFDFDTKTVKHGVFSKDDEAWTYTPVQVKKGSYYFIEDILSQPDQLAGYKGIVVWVGAPNYFSTFAISSVLDFSDLIDRPLNTMKALIERNGFFAFGDTGSSWIFHNLQAWLDNNVFGALEKAHIELPSSNMSRRIVIDVHSKTLYVEDAANGQGIFYLIRDGVLTADPTQETLDIVGAAFVMPFCFDDFSEADLILLANYIHFSRPQGVVDNIADVYEQVMTAVGYGIKHQQEINDFQTQAINSKIDQIYLENQNIPSSSGRVDFPIVAAGGVKTNPYYVGRFLNLDTLKQATNAVDYVSFLNPDAPVPLGYFAYLLMERTVAAVTVTDTPSETPLIDAVKKQTEAFTGTRVNAIDFKGLDNYFLSASNQGEPTFLTVYLYDYVMDSGTTSLIGFFDIVIGEMSNGSTLYLQIGSRKPVRIYEVESDGTGVPSEITVGNNFNESANGVTASWDRDSTTLTFSRPVGLSFANEDSFKLFAERWQTQPSILGPSSTAIAWTNTGERSGRPPYLDYIVDNGRGNPGAIRASQYEQLITDSRKLELVASLAAGDMLNGIVISYNSNGTDAGDWSMLFTDSIVPEDAIQQLEYVYTNGTLTAHHWGPGIDQTLTIFEDGDWVFPETYFDPARELGDFEGIHYLQTSTGTPFADTRFLYERIVNVPFLRNEIKSQASSIAELKGQIAELQSLIQG